MSQPHVRFQEIPRGRSRSTTATSKTFEFQKSSGPNVETLGIVELAKTIFFQSLQDVIPSKLITSQIQLQGSLLMLEDEKNTTVDLSQYNKKYVVGFGKACLLMAESLLQLLNGLVDRCVISVPVATRRSRNNSVEVFQGAKNNIPDEDALTASKEIVELVRSCTPDDLLIILISFGGSALLPYPIPPVTLEEKSNLIKTLSKVGCTINEMNTVRKRLSLVKGGGLAQMCQARQAISLIISDVLGSPLDIIASGPTVPNPDLPEAAFRVLEKYGLIESISSNIKTVLKRRCENTDFSRLHKGANFIIGDNQLALEAAANAATKCGLHPFIITSRMSGEAADVGYHLGSLADSFANCIRHNSEDESFIKPHLDAMMRLFKKNRWSTEGVILDILKEHKRSNNGVCLLFGGETTVTVRGNGTGGRNQEMALSAGIRLDICRSLFHVMNKLAIFCAGTDGVDGPNDAAGAVVEGLTIHKAQMQGLSSFEHLNEKNSYNFFKNAANGSYHIACGYTETNVMDIAMIVILKKEAKKEQQRSLL